MQVATYWRLIQEKIPRALLVGQTTSTLGNRLYQMAIFWLIWHLSHSTALAGYSALVAGGASLLGGAWASTIVDRCDRLQLARRMDLLRFALTLLLPVAAVWHVLSVVIVYTVVALMAGLSAVFDPAYEAVLPSLIEPARLSVFLGLMDMPARIARIAGPGMAGFLLAVMPITGFFVIDAGTFAVSAISLWRVQHWAQEVASCKPQNVDSHQVRQRVVRNRRGLFTDLRLSLSTLGSDPLIAPISILDGVGNVLFPVFTLGAMVDSKVVLHAGAAGYGWLIAAYGLGGLFGNALAGQSLSVVWRSVLALSGWGGIGLSFVLMGVSHSLLWTLFAALVAGACGALAHVSRSVLTVVRVPTQELGRLHALRNIIGTVATAIGTAVVGWFLADHSVTVALQDAGLLLVVVYGTVACSLARRKRSPVMIHHDGL